MKVKALHIHRRYRTDAPLRGEVEFVDADGTELKMKLDEQLSIEVVHLCASAIARSGKQAADALTAECRERRRDRASARMNRPRTDGLIHVLGIALAFALVVFWVVT